MQVILRSWHSRTICLKNHTIFLRPTRKPTNLEVKYLIQVTDSLIFKNMEINRFCAKLRVHKRFRIQFVLSQYDLFYGNVSINNSRGHKQSVIAYFLSIPRLAQLLSHENVSSMSLPGWLSRQKLEDQPFQKKIHTFECKPKVLGAILAKTLFANHRILSQASNVAFSSPVSSVSLWNAWDHDPPFGERTVAFSDSGFLTEARVIS